MSIAFRLDVDLEQEPPKRSLLERLFRLAPESPFNTLLETGMYVGTFNAEGQEILAAIGQDPHDEGSMTGHELAAKLRAVLPSLSDDARVPAAQVVVMANRAGDRRVRWG
jgi:hypothetical protein